MGVIEPRLKRSRAYFGYAGGVLLSAYLFYGMLTLWLTLATYESYRYTDKGESE